jgi:hypothetical protein
VFLLALTIFNHADHGHWMERVPQALVEDAGKVFPDRADADNLADYVWRTREFASAYEATRASVLGASRPAVIAWFGDHQPPFGGAPALRAAIRSRSTPPLPARQFSWYEIDRNFGDRVDAGAQPLDIVFLGGLLAERAGVPLDEWLAANVQARERCMRLLAECAVPQVRDAYFTYLLRDLQATSQ